MNEPKVGLLPFYLELYDKSLPEMRKRINFFLDTIKVEYDCKEVSREVHKQYGRRNAPCCAGLW